MNFFKNFFLAAGVVWTLSAVAILLFQLNLGPQEIIISLIFSLAYAIIRLFEKSNQSNKVEQSQF